MIEDKAKALRELVTHYDELLADAADQRRFLMRVASAMGFSPGAIPRRYTNSGNLEEVVLKVLADAKINAYDIARRASGDDDQ